MRATVKQLTIRSQTMHQRQAQDSQASFQSYIRLTVLGIPPKLRQTTRNPPYALHSILVGNPCNFKRSEGIWQTFDFTFLTKCAI